MTGRFRPEPMELGEVPSEDIYINPKSRDDIPKILPGIRSFVSNKEFTFARENILEAGFHPGSVSGQGRPGIDLRRTFVLGVLNQGTGMRFRSPVSSRARGRVPPQVSRSRGLHRQMRVQTPDAGGQHPPTAPTLSTRTTRRS